MRLLKPIDVVIFLAAIAVSGLLAKGVHQQREDCRRAGGATDHRQMERDGLRIQTGRGPDKPGHCSDVEIARVLSDHAKHVAPDPNSPWLTGQRRKI